ncbi:MAG: flagellar hook-associated protein FlgK, partial [Deltaproteobacteria bacterium]|nr:flagellar hook-associated protein FlgK [Deltaproteobacteria bacterium]
MGVSSSLYTALTGMRMSQAAMEVASHNIANVNTAGYSRQRINLATLPSQNYSFGQVGMGVTANNVIRYHDEFLTRSLIMTGSGLGRDVALKNQTDTLEAFYNESAGGGINQAMNDFFASFDQLADEASNKPYREELVEYSQTLAAQLQFRHEEMGELRRDTNKRIDDAAKAVNTLINEIAALNKEITAEEDPALNRQANDLRDARDEKTRQLAEYMDIQYYEDPQDGQWTVTSSAGVPLVLKDRAFELRTGTRSNGDVSLHTTHNDYWMEEISGQIKGGAIGGYLEFRDEVLEETWRQYDSFVDGLIFSLNDQHAQGASTSLFTELQAATLISNRASLVVEFPGDDNDLKISSLVPHVPSREPYDPYSDPENIEVKFVKSTKATSEITSQVVFNNDPARMKWEITVTLPVDSLGNVAVTARELADYINSERSASPTEGNDYLPPRTSGWKVGDFISAEGAVNQGDSGRVDFAGPTFPQGHELTEFYTLDRSLKYTAPQGHHLSYGSEYAAFTTRQIHTDNDLIFTAVAKGEAGDKVAIEYAAAGASQPLRVSVAEEEDGTRRITVLLATDANGTVTTTAGDIATAINTHSVARTLVTAETPAGETGHGLVDPMEKTYLDRSGYFELVTYPADGEAYFHKVTVTPDDTLQDVIDQLQDIPGLRVENITDRNGLDSLRIIADDGVGFTFAGDSSGALAVLGINTLFTGSSGNDVAVNQTVINNRDLINAGKTDSNGKRAPGDNTNALDMADVKGRILSFYRQPAATLGSMFNAIYADLGATAQGITRDYEFDEGVYTQLQ